MDAALFRKRLTAFYSSWSSRKEDVWGNCDVLVVHGPPENSSENPVSSFFFTWLFGCEMPDTTTIFTPTAIYFLCTQNGFQFLRGMSGYITEFTKLMVFVNLKGRGDDGFALMDSILINLRVSMKGREMGPIVIGSISGEYPRSKLFLNCNRGFAPNRYQSQSVNSGLAILFIDDRVDNGSLITHQSSGFNSDQTIQIPILSERILKLLCLSDANMDKEVDMEVDTAKVENMGMKEDRQNQTPAEVGEPAENYTVDDCGSSSSSGDTVIVTHDDSEWDDWELIDGDENTGLIKSSDKRVPAKRGIIHQLSRSLGIS